MDGQWQQSPEQHVPMVFHAGGMLKSCSHMLAPLCTCNATKGKPSSPFLSAELHEHDCTSTEPCHSTEASRSHLNFSIHTPLSHSQSKIQTLRASQTIEKQNDQAQLLSQRCHTRSLCGFDLMPLPSPEQRLMPGPQTADPNVSVYLCRHDPIRRWSQPCPLPAAAAAAGHSLQAV